MYERVIRRIVPKDETLDNYGNVLAVSGYIIGI